MIKFLLRILDMFFKDEILQTDRQLPERAIEIEIRCNVHPAEIINYKAMSTDQDFTCEHCLTKIPMPPIRTNIIGYRDNGHTCNFIILTE